MKVILNSDSKVWVRGRREEERLGGQKVNKKRTFVWFSFAVAPLGEGQKLPKSEKRAMGEGVRAG